MLPLKKYDDGKEYRVTEDGTHYSANTPQAIIDALENARRNRYRIRIFSGYTEAYPPEAGVIGTKFKIGEAWECEHDCMGYIGRTTGRHSPILVFNKRSHGGGLISTNSIVAIKITGGSWLYRHPKFTTGKYELGEYSNMAILHQQVLHNGEEVARFETREKAQRYIDFMSGKRDGK